MPNNIPPLIDDQRIITDCTQKADTFNNHFAKQSKLPPHASDHPLPDFKFLTDQRLDEIVCTPEEIHKILLSLNPSKSTGPEPLETTY